MEGTQSSTSRHFFVDDTRLLAGGKNVAWLDTSAYRSMRVQRQKLATGGVQERRSCIARCLGHSLCSGCTSVASRVTKRRAVGCISIDPTAISEALEVRLDEVFCLVSLETARMPAKENHACLERFLILFSVIRGVWPRCNCKVGAFACILLRQGAGHIRMISKIVLVLFVCMPLSVCPGNSA